MVRGIVGLAVGLLVVGAVVLYGIPNLGLRTPHPLTPEEELQFLENRVRQYWQARAKDDMPTAFEFEDPVRQKRFGVSGYWRSVGGAMRIEDVNVLRVTICPGGELADARLRMRYEAWITGTKPIRATTYRTDNWQKLDGTWYHVLDFRPIRAKRPIIQGTNPEITCTER